jgi:cell wall-associated NlpC family hydrolase
MTNPKNEWHGGNYNDAFWNGFWKGARVGSTIVAVNNIIESFGSVAKTADGHDILKNHEALKQKGVGLDNLSLSNNEMSLIDYDVKNAEFADKMMQQRGWEYTWNHSEMGKVDCWGGIKYSLREMGYSKIDNYTLEEFASLYTTSASNAYSGTISVIDWNYMDVRGPGMWDHVVTNITGGNVVHASSGYGDVRIIPLWNGIEKTVERMDTRQLNWYRMEMLR